jgi:hypothetical protein
MAYCANHPQTTAAAYCRTCGKPLCESCKRDVRGVIYCEECLAQRLAGDPAVAGAVPPPPIPNAPAGQAGAQQSASNPVLAGILGFLFPGVGAMYNGQFGKGLLHIGVFILLIKLTEDANELFGVAIVGWIFYMAFEAYHTAKARQMGMPEPDFLGFNKMFGLGGTTITTGETYTPGAYAPGNAPETPARSGVPAGAFWLIGLGSFFLLANIGEFWHIGRYLWEFVVIGFGVYLGYERWTGGRRYRGITCQCTRCRMQGMMGPAMMVTAGVLGLLASGHILGWHNSWPVFLIVAGAIRLAQMSASTEGHVEYVPPTPPSAAPPIPPAADQTTGSVGGA